MHWSLYLTVKKQFSELMCNRLDSFTQCEAVTDIVEISGYTDTSNIDIKAYGELNPFAHPSTTEAATLCPFESHETNTLGNVMLELTTFIGIL